MAARAGLTLALLLSAAAIADGTTVPAGWVDVAVDHAFVIKAPPGTTFAQTRGTDSFTGTLNGPGIAIQVDYGAHASPLEPDRSVSGYLARDVVVDGRAAKLVTARRTGATRSYFIGLHVPVARRTPGHVQRLTLTATAAQPDEAGRVETAMRSVRFE
jgi:hypothetical protein